MGPGFGEEIGKSMMAGCIALVVVAAGVSIALWELGKWIFRHLQVAWN